MSKRMVTAKFPDGTAITRRTEAAYTYASRKRRGGTVRFHTSEQAARRAAGTYGQVVATNFDTAAVIPDPEPQPVVVAVRDRDGNEVARYTIEAEVYKRRGPIVALHKARDDGHTNVASAGRVKA